MGAPRGAAARRPLVPLGPGALPPVGWVGLRRATCVPVFSEGEPLFKSILFTVVANNKRPPGSPAPEHSAGHGRESGKARRRKRDAAAAARAAKAARGAQAAERTPEDG